MSSGGDPRDLTPKSGDAPPPVDDDDDETPGDETPGDETPGGNELALRTKYNFGDTGELFDLEREGRGYARSNLSEQERQAIDEERQERGGFMKIKDVRDLIHSNTIKQTLDAGSIEWNCAVDPELMMMLDVRIDYKIFIAGDNVFTREDLIDAYPFREFGRAPEEIFVQQEIGVFPAKKHAIESGDHEYIARDAGDPDDFVMIEDLVGRAARRNHRDYRRPIRVFKTKIYVGRETWDDFKMMRRFVRSFMKLIPTLEGGESTFGSTVKALTYVKTGGVAALRDASGVEEERRDREEFEAFRREKKAREHEEELRRREEEVRWREAEACRIEERIAQRERLFEEAKLAREEDEQRRARVRASRELPGGPQGPEDPETAEPGDSVPLF